MTLKAFKLVKQHRALPMNPHLVLVAHRAIVSIKTIDIDPLQPDIPVLLAFCEAIMTYYRTFIALLVVQPKAPGGSG